MLAPSPFVDADAALDAFARRSASSAATIRSSLLRRLMGEIYARFEYSPQSTRVDSPIDDALEARRGVCQDFAHIFIALVRPLGIPAATSAAICSSDAGSHDRSADGATHAWVEALPARTSAGSASIPTNNLIAERPAHPRRHRPRLRRRAADARRLQGRERRAQRAGGRRAGRTGAVAARRAT